MAKTGDFKIEGFPDFKATLEELKAFQKCPMPTFAVCVAAGHSLVVKDALVQFWASKPEFSEKVEGLLSKHDQEFNPTGLKRGLATQTNGNADAEDPEPASKRLRLSSAKTLNELEGEFPERFLGLHSNSNKWFHFLQSWLRSTEIHQTKNILKLPTKDTTKPRTTWDPRYEDPAELRPIQFDLGGSWWIPLDWCHSSLHGGCVYRIVWCGVRGLCETVWSDRHYVRFLCGRPLGGLLNQWCQHFGCAGKDPTGARTSSTTQLLEQG